MLDVLVQKAVKQKTGDEARGKAKIDGKTILPPVGGAEQQSRDCQAHVMVEIYDLADAMTHAFTEPSEYTVDRCIYIFPILYSLFKVGS